MLSLLQRRKTEQTRAATAADISGSVSDSQLAIGEHIVQNNIAAGAIVNQIAGQQGTIPPRARDKPVSVKPREAPRLVGRDKELDAATSALAARERPSAPEQLDAQIVETLTPEARQALMLMAALGGAPLHTDHVAAPTGSRDTASLLADLEERGLAKSHSPRYSVTDAVAALRPADAESRWRRQLLTYFAEHAEAHAPQPQRLRDDLEPIIATLRSGARGVALWALTPSRCVSRASRWRSGGRARGGAGAAARRAGDHERPEAARAQAPSSRACVPRAVVARAVPSGHHD